MINDLTHHKNVLINFVLTYQPSQVACTKFVQIMIGNQTYILNRGSNNTIPNQMQYGVEIEELFFFTQLVSDQLGLRVMWDKSNSEIYSHNRTDQQ